jgi:hypothetical protein
MPKPTGHNGCGKAANRPPLCDLPQFQKAVHDVF